MEGPYESRISYGPSRSYAKSTNYDAMGTHVLASAPALLTRSVMPPTTRTTA
jgi:hypothetical protein